MDIAFVGIKRPFRSIPDEVGIDIWTFVQFHLELPWYYSKYGRNHCYITTVDHEWKTTSTWLTGAEPAGDRGLVTLLKEDDLSEQIVDVVVHWRSWQEWAYEKCPDAVHIIQTCDHTYSTEWKDTVRHALSVGKLSKIIAFETWHVRQLQQELGIGVENFVTQVHLGVDTEIYRPSVDKDPYQLLWASDPGRGLGGCFAVFQELFKMDHRYRLHITYPDYVKERPSISHPGVRIHHNLRNGPVLWELFNTSAVIPYKSIFPEPSSRVHRQGQAAGCVVAYPSDMGSPSELIINGRTGLVIPRALNEYEWAKMIIAADHKAIGESARMFALTEDWEVQAVRFNRVMRELL